MRIFQYYGLMEHAQERLNISVWYSKEEAAAIRRYFREEGLKVGPFVRAYLLRVARAGAQVGTEQEGAEA